MVANASSSFPIVLAADSGAGGGFFSFILIFGPLFAIWYFLVIRPQQSQRRKTQGLLANLKTGDRVVTTGGIYGTVAGFRDSIVQLQVTPQVRLDVARSAISGLAEGETRPEGAAGPAGQDPARRDAAAKGRKS